jgi:methionine-S-sulfoxide reductase
MKKLFGIIIISLLIFLGLAMTFKTEPQKNINTIYLAGGCFWGVEAYFSKLPGVINTEVGYANGKTQNPTYEEVLSGNTNFAETVKVEYDSNKISLNDILSHYFDIVNPTTLNKQSMTLVLNTEVEFIIYKIKTEIQLLLRLHKNKKNTKNQLLRKSKN